jgi:cellulose synthase/poly-beta-1,6-N-acetylglucosamine synthase-like glycosyltransferase
VLIIFLVAAAIQVLYYALVFARVGFIRSSDFIPEGLPPVSVIICAHNEAENLKRFLKVVLIQQYPQFEVILVNDASTDNTIDVMVDYYTRNTNVRILNITANEKKGYAGKKYALLKGVELARFDTIVLTDADCRPATTHWLSHMVGAYMNGTGIVLGYSPFEKRKGFLNKFIRYENVVTAMLYIGFAKAGLPYMGVGRNLSYKKELFNTTDVFQKYKALPTGDDDLFINAVAKGHNTEVCLNKNAFTYTQASVTFKEWLNKKRRHLRSGFKYKFHHRLLLFVFALSGLLFYAAATVLFVSMFSLKISLTVFIFVLLLKWLLSFNVYRKLQATDLLLFSFLLDVLYVLYLLFVFFLLLLKPKNNWN